MDPIRPDTIPQDAPSMLGQVPAPGRSSILQPRFVESAHDRRVDGGRLWHQLESGNELDQRRRRLSPRPFDLWVSI